jgi:hypothetical protein
VQKQKSRRSLVLREKEQAVGGTGNRFREPVRPERLSASVQKLQSLGRSPGLENAAFATPEVVSSSLITVARPRGILTRFPILPISLGHPDALECKEQFLICRGHYHACASTVKLAPCAVHRAVLFRTSLCFHNSPPVRFLGFSTQKEPT